MRGVRILRYVGNREHPEKEVYDPVERWAHYCEPISSQTFLGLDDATILRIAKDVANPLLSDFHKEEGGILFTPNTPKGEVFFAPYLHAFGLAGLGFTTNRVKENPKKPDELDFEVNMMEPLVGWKSWFLDSGILKSNSGCFLWDPLKAAEAVCNTGCSKVPAEHHTCGIYASESRETAEEYGSVLGRVYGWGRYIRHEDGWKAQFAYPECFHLREEQIGLVDELKQYQVPIYVSQPMRMYDPNEEDYCGYWTEEANGNSGTDPEPVAGEERNPGEDDED